MYAKTIGIGDSYGTRIEINGEPPEDEEDDPTVSINVSLGFCGGRAFASPEVARQVAAAILDAADAAEADGG